MGKGSGQQRRQVVDYRMGLHLGFCVGEVDELTRIRIGEKVAWQGAASTQSAITINKPELFGGEQKEGGVEGIAYFLPGKSDQLLPAGLAARLGLTPSQAPGYRNIASIWFVGELGSAGFGGGWAPTDPTYQGVEGGLVSRLSNQAARFAGFLWGKNSPFIQPAWATFKRIPKGFAPQLATIGPDANPAHIIYDVLTSTDYGKGDPASSIDTTGSFLDAAQTLYDEEFGLSLKWTRQGKIEAFIQEILDHIQGLLFVDPRTGKWVLKLLRDDYNPNTVLTFNMENAELLSFQRKAWGEIVNEIVVAWTNPETEQEETITVQNLAAIEAQGDVSSDSRNYYAARNVDLGTRLAYRDLRQSSTPLAVTSLEVPKEHWTLAPGSVVRFDWPQHEINGIVFRVMSVTRGSKKSHVRLNLVEDIFSLTRPALPSAPGTSWEDPSIDPPQLATNAVFTLPYPLAARLGMAGVEDGFLYPEAVTAVLMHHESSEVTGIDLYAETVLPDSSTRYEHIGSRQLSGYAILTSPFAQEVETDYLDTPGVTTGRTPIEGGFALIGSGADASSEIALVKARPEGGWILQRGAFDTVPRAWATGTPIWFFDSSDAIADKSRIRGAGETANYKPLARTNRGTLDLASVSAVTATVSDRAHRPHRPANISVNGQAFGAVDISVADEVSVTWSRRNRLAEDASPAAWDAGDVIPEAGQTTAIRLIATNGSVIKTWPELPATAFKFDKSVLGANTAAYMEVLSTRDGFASLQNWGSWLLDGATNPGAPPTIPDIDDVPPPNQGRVEAPKTYGANICPDPYFQDREFWNIAGSNWQSVSRSGSDIPTDLQVPKALVLSEQWFSGSAAQTVSSDLVVGLPAAEGGLYFFAKGKNDSNAPVTVRVQFYRSDLNLPVGESTDLVFKVGETDSLGVKVERPLTADAARFEILSAAGTWVGSAGISNIVLVEYGSAGQLELEAALDAARDAINARLGSVHATLADAAEEAAALSATGAHYSLLNWLEDPLFRTGTAGFVATRGHVNPVAGSPRGIEAVWSFTASGVQTDRILTWPGRKPVRRYDGVQASVDVRVVGALTSVSLQAVWSDGAGDVLSTSELASGSTGRIGGVAFAPENAASVEIRLVPTSDAAAIGAVQLHQPKAAYALPGQTTADGFEDPQNETVSRIERVERTLAGVAQTLKSMQVETRTGRARYRSNVTAIADETSARVSAFESLSTAFTALEGNVYTKAQADALFFTESDVDGSIAAYNLTLQAQFQNATTGFYTRAQADALFYAEADVNGAIAGFDLSANATFASQTASVTANGTAISDIEGNLAARFAIAVDGGGNGSFISLEDGTTTPSKITLGADLIELDGDVIVNGTLTASALATGADGEIVASGTVANFYSQSTDPAPVSNGSLWFKSSTSELFIRISSAWSKIADISLDSGFSVSLSTSSVSGAGTTGSIAANPTGGAMPYRWYWECVNDSGIVTNAYPTSPTSQTTTVSSASAETGQVRCTVSDANGVSRTVVGFYTVT